MASSYLLKTARTNIRLLTRTPQVKSTPSSSVPSSLFTARTCHPQQQHHYSTKIHSSNNNIAQGTSIPKPPSFSTTASLNNASTVAAPTAASASAAAAATATAAEAAASSTPLVNPQKLGRFRKYAEQFKNKPASHLISFGILHEITAVVPLYLVYFGLDQTGIKVPFPERFIEEGNRYVARVAKHYNWDLEGADGARIDAATNCYVSLDDPMDRNQDHIPCDELLEAV
ncbi:hypothetical protein BGZ94_008742 [Podila epigama]|nr:hypothetical protein BGZ94_008742 [Podila epigama]